MALPARDDVPDAVPPKGAGEQHDEAPTWRGGKSSDDALGFLERVFGEFRRLFEDDLADLSSILPVLGRMEDQDISRYMEDDDACQEDFVV